MAAFVEKKKVSQCAGKARRLYLLGLLDHFAFTVHHHAGSLSVTMEERPRRSNAYGTSVIIRRLVSFLPGSSHHSPASR
jgi:hypothetical protein